VLLYKILSDLDLVFVFIIRLLYFNLYALFMGNIPFSRKIN